MLFLFPEFMVFLCNLPNNSAGITSRYHAGRNILGHYGA